MEEIVFHHTLPIQLRFNDVDKFGHVNNTVYFSFYDLGKTEYFGSVCPGVDWEKIGIVVVHIEANFVKQIFASDHIAVQTAVSKIGTKSFHLVQQVIDTKTNEVKCVCIVSYSWEICSPVPLDAFIGAGGCLHRWGGNQSMLLQIPSFILSILKDMSPCH